MEHRPGEACNADYRDEEYKGVLTLPKGQEEANPIILYKLH
jgi:hypothetical protein